MICRCYLLRFGLGVNRDKMHLRGRGESPPHPGTVAACSRRIFPGKFGTRAGTEPWGDGVGAAAPAPALLHTSQRASRSTMNKGQNLSLREAEMVQMARICPKS